MTAPFQHQRGSAIFLILIVIVLFAALAFAVSQGFRVNSGSTNAASEERMRLALVDIQNAMEAHRLAIYTMISSGVSVDEIDASDPAYFPYTNSSCTSGRCKLYDPEGGRLSWLRFPIVYSDLSDVPNDTATYPNWPNGLFMRQIAYMASTRADIYYTLRVTTPFCNFINKSLGINVDAESFTPHGAMVEPLRAGTREMLGNVEHHWAPFGDPGDVLQNKVQFCYRSSDGGSTYRYLAILHKT